ncbi:MAG: TolC family protein [Casimicrobiaceae bacterium]
MTRNRLVIALLAVAVGGCADYAPRPLPLRPDAPASAAAIAVDPARLPFRDLSTHRFDSSDGLDIDEVAMLAVANNPQLRAARDALGIARAQSFAAGLLPDPQLGITADHPTSGLGFVNAFGLTPSYDVNALLLRSSRMGVAHANERQVDLDLLWREWQVVSQARLLFTRLTAQDAVLRELESVRRVLDRRYRADRKALADGDLTIDVTSSDLVALQRTERQVNDLERAQLQNRGSLNALLGLSADADLQLVGAPRLPALDAARLRSEVPLRLAQRPDLRALRAGYRSQEEKFRGEVLAQFPALTVGLTRARDTSDLYTLGFGLSLSLPMFNANRGNIAIADATRSKLYDEYQARLDAARGDVDTALTNIDLLQRQVRRTREGVAQLGRADLRADAAFRAGDMSAPVHERLRIALLDKKTEAINLEEALMEQRIALQTLLGPDLRGPAADPGGAR